MHHKMSSDEIFSLLEQICGPDWYIESSHPVPEDIRKDPTGKIFKALFDLDEIQAIQDSFATATGIASIITTVDGEPLTKPSNFCEVCESIIRKTPKGRKNCYISDAIIGRYHQDGPVIQECLSGGLFDAGASITAGPVHIANWLIGQVKNSSTDMNKMRAYAREIGADEARFLEALDKVTVMPFEQFRNIANFLFLIANQMSQRAYQDLKRRYLDEKSRQLEHQLRQDEKIKAMGRLAKGVAHDSNNMLGGICGYLDLLSFKMPADDPHRKYVTSARAAAQKMSDLILEMQMITNTTPLPKEMTGLNELVYGLLQGREGEVFQSKYPHIRYKTELGAGLPKINGIRNQIRKAIANLLVNAAEAMPEGGHVFIRTENRFMDASLKDHQIPLGNYVVLSVTDEGGEISQEDVDKLFEPFHTKKKMGRDGTGLGMSVVSGMMQDHNGHITVEGKPGKGMVITLFFPATQIEQAESVPEVSHSPQSSLPPKAHKTILVVDDIAEQREMASTVLTMLGYSVDTAASGNEALTHLETHSPDLLMLDMIMAPGIDGLETYQEALKIRPNQKAVIVSGYAASERVQKTLELGASAFVKKPYTLHEIRQAIHKALSDS